VSQRERGLGLSWCGADECGCCSCAFPAGDVKPKSTIQCTVRLRRRLNASHEAAEKYIGQFPSPLLAQAARFVAFIAGSFAALFLGAALVDDQLLERRLAGRTLVW